MKPIFTALPDQSLPVFQAVVNNHACYYTPGCLAGVAREDADNFNQYLAGDDRNGQSPVATDDSHAIMQRMAHSVLEAARSAERSWQVALQIPFSPLCLTLYPHNKCNLACSYCFSDARSNDEQPPLSCQVIQTASQMTAQNCQAAGRPLTVVFQGGGEPALNQAWVEKALDIVERTARQQGVDIFKYIATNGVMSSRKADWMASRFDMIGLSCDGPADIQSMQRPLIDGQPSSTWVEQTARTVRQRGKLLHVRVTITPTTMHRQPEIARYVCTILQPVEIHVEPVYVHGRASTHSNFQLLDADQFVRFFFEAQRISHSFGIPWKTSCSRPDELHGPYCHIFRSVLQLVPGGSAVACFLTRDSLRSLPGDSWIGSYDETSDTTLIDKERINQLRKRLAVFPDRCTSCFNRFHCVRGCPDACPLRGDTYNCDFRCHLSSQLTATWLEELANARKESPAWLQRLPLVMQ